MPYGPPPVRAADRIEFLDALRGFALTGVCAANLFLFSGYSFLSDAQRAAMPTAPFFGRLTEEIGYLALTLAYGAALALLFRRAGWARILRTLAPVGRMALTCYLIQTLAGLWLFYGFLPGPHAMGKVGPSVLLPLAAASYALQAWFASVWLRRFRFGPVEWLWRCLTYGRIQPFVRTERMPG